MRTCITNCLSRIGGLGFWITLLVVSAIMGAVAATGGGGAIVLALAIKGALLGMGVMGGTLLVGCILNCVFGK